MNTHTVSLPPVLERLQSAMEKARISLELKRVRKEIRTLIAMGHTVSKEIRDGKLIVTVTIAEQVYVLESGFDRGDGEATKLARKSSGSSRTRKSKLGSTVSEARADGEAAIAWAVALFPQVIINPELGTAVPFTWDLRSLAASDTTLEEIEIRAAEYLAYVDPHSNPLPETPAPTPDMEFVILAGTPGVAHDRSFESPLFGVRAPA